MYPHLLQILKLFSFATTVLATPVPFWDGSARQTVSGRKNTSSKQDSVFDKQE
jgi:hypothetical protein